MAPITENRDISSDRPREAVRRVEPVDQADRSASIVDHPQDRTADIERMAAETLSNSRLKILQDNASGDYIYLLVDQDTGETVRRWPPEKHADLMEYLRTRTAGLLDQRA
ncbi:MULTISPECIES: flagellar protein FlaG [Maricaulis]|uniref:Putative FlaG/YvyC family protein n=1 Tax=Maricaulis maris TaxID=74318 RepID=A0A495DCW0_9PROT|nr:MULTISPECIES: flagellar protein FlaG [Maricaulis]RKR00167.1 putative FlaG/YvyC family protein [Maricaulis maris]